MARINKGPGVLANAFNRGGAILSRSIYGLYIYGRHLSHAARAWWHSAPHLLTLAYAARGTVAMMAPFIGLLIAGYPEGAVFAALGGMYTIFADTGGAYQRRLGAMLIAVAAGAGSLFIASILPAAFGLAPLILALVAFGGSMARALGEAGNSTGLCVSLMFLTGLVAPQSTDQAAAFTACYALGGAWTVLFQLVAWRLRPYWVLLGETAACYEACAQLVTTLSIQIAGANPGATRRRMRRRHKRARATIRSAERTLEMVRLGAGQAVPVFDRVLTYLSAASREAVAVVSLRATAWPAPGTDAAQAWERFFTRWREALMAVAAALQKERGAVPTDELHAAFDDLEARGLVTSDTRAPLRLALQQLDTVVNNIAEVAGFRFGWLDGIPHLAPNGLQSVQAALAGQFTFRAINFRHALRVGVTAGFGLWIADMLNASHVMWLPMTAIIVLQPEFGATWQRLWERIGGTLVGVLLAGGIHFLLQDSGAEIAVIILFSFGMFFFTRSSYGLGVVMLTPLFLLLLTVLNPTSPTSIFVYRCLDTVFGATLALAAAYLLWPMWQRSGFRERCAAAALTQRDYIAAVFALAGDDDIANPELMRLRHIAERENDNVEACLRRMLSEPRRTRRDARAGFGFITYLRRIADAAAGFALELSGGDLSPAARSLGAELTRALETIAAVLSGQADPADLQAIQPVMAADAFSNPALGHWFERLSVDVATLAVATRKVLPIERRRRIVRLRLLRSRKEKQLRSAVGENRGEMAMRD
jgi:uncharacterized membrane protein YccC